MNGLWCYYLKKWSPEYCDEILSKAEKYNWETGTVGNSKVDYNSLMQIIQNLKICLMTYG